MADPNRNLAECPRCGYDLTGQVDSWAESCPLRGVCSECGLALEFRKLLNPALARTRWFFEVAERRLGKALVLTALKALRPWKFWRWVGMEDRIHRGRVWAGPLLGAIALYIPLTVMWTFLLWALGELQQLRGGYSYYGFFDGLRYALIEVWNPLSDSFGWSFGAWLDPLAAHMLLGVLLTLLTPLGFLCLPITLRSAKVRKLHLVRISAWSVLMLVLLPQASKCILQALGQMEGMLFPGPGDYVYYFARKHEGRVFFGLLFIWTVLWWFYACRDYLRLPRALGIACSMVTMALLLSILIALFVPGALVSIYT